MADHQAPENNSQENQQTGSSQSQFRIQKVYLKDASYEAPGTPAVFGGGDWNPQIDFQLSNASQKVTEGLYEVVLSVTVTARQDDQTVFLAEVQQAGLFSVEGFGDAERGPLLGSFCPNILFPFARQEIADLVVKGGFPQVLLAPVNFEALYARHVQEQQQKASGDGDA